MDAHFSRRVRRRLYRSSTPRRGIRVPIHSMHVTNTFLTVVRDAAADTDAGTARLATASWHAGSRVASATSDTSQNSDLGRDLGCSTVYR